MPDDLAERLPGMLDAVLSSRGGVRKTDPPSSSAGRSATRRSGPKSSVPALIPRLPIWPIPRPEAGMLDWRRIPEGSPDRDRVWAPRWCDLGRPRCQSLSDTSGAYVQTGSDPFRDVSRSFAGQRAGGRPHSVGILGSRPSAVWLPKWSDCVAGFEMPRFAGHGGHREDRKARVTPIRRGLGTVDGRR